MIPSQAPPTVPPAAVTTKKLKKSKLAQYKPGLFTARCVVSISDDFCAMFTILDYTRNLYLEDYLQTQLPNTVTEDDYVQVWKNLDGETKKVSHVFIFIAFELTLYTAPRNINTVKTRQKKQRH